MPEMLREVSGVRADALPADVLQSTAPLVLRGLVTHWPLVQAAQQSDVHVCNYLRRFGAGNRVGIWRGAPEIAGRFFYNDDFSGFNYLRQVGQFSALLDELLSVAAHPRPPALYVGSTAIDTFLPGMRTENDLALGVYDPLVSLWFGNRTRVAAHFDLADNVACVVAGRRRFTLFAPEQVANLYVGPLDFTPAGQPISLVDLAQPDLQRFPRFAQAQAHAITAELAPGDAIFIPSLWWHAVEALDAINGLVNYWWRQSPPFMDSPLNTLVLAQLTLRDLPPAQRKAWKAMFDHYVFEADDSTAAHVPPAVQGVLAPFSEDGARNLRAVLLKRLNR